MSSHDFYDYQASARGLHAPGDVDAMVRLMGPTYRRILRGWLPASRDAAIYEVACGPGIMLRFLREEGYTNLAGSDFAACQVDLAKAAGLPVKQSDSLLELQCLGAATLDCVIGLDFVEHLPKEEFMRFLELSHRALKVGGCLILRLPNGSSPLVGLHLFNDITHQWAYTTHAMRALFHMFGFKDVVFVDETVPSIREKRWIKVPLTRLAQGLLRGLIRAVTREHVTCLSPSFYTAAWKR